MIREIEIEGFKSIEKLKLELGRVTVLIGENGCGKSNILEAIAFASAAIEDRLDHEFLSSRGIRAVEPSLMRPRFAEEQPATTRVRFHLNRAKDFDRILTIEITEDDSTVSPTWRATRNLGPPRHLDDSAEKRLDAELEAFLAKYAKTDEQRSSLLDQLEQYIGHGYYKDTFSNIVGYFVFSPENSALRTFEREGQILPLGINGEGLFAHLRALERARKTEVLESINHRLSLIDWFSGFELPRDLNPGERRLSIRDRFLSSNTILDQRSANEGFLLLLFYYTLLLSPETPHFFAVDNIDASLNPRLCARLMRDVVELAKERDRRLIVTTHNPAILDGLDLTDDDQRLIVVSRTERGTTRARRVSAPKSVKGAPGLRLSEAFIRGYLGGLPSNF